MLKGIPEIISPGLMYTLMSMGHGDEIVIADGNFPAASIANHLVRADGHGAVEVLDAITRFLPLDDFVKDNAIVMSVEGPKEKDPVIWSDFRRIITESEKKKTKLTSISRDTFYIRAKKAYAVIATGETALYANLILKKGVVVKNTH